MGSSIMKRLSENLERRLETINYKGLVLGEEWISVSISLYRYLYK